MSDKLKPCRHCGSPAKYYSECDMVKVVCSNYDCQSSMIGWFDEPEDAAAAWNKEPAPHKYTVEELRGMNGRPAYILFGDGVKGWAILEWDSEDILFLLPADRPDWNEEPDLDFYNMECDFDPDGHYGLHVLGWVAYDREPEGVEDATI